MEKFDINEFKAGQIVSGHVGKFQIIEFRMMSGMCDTPGYYVREVHPETLEPHKGGGQLWFDTKFLRRYNK